MWPSPFACGTFGRAYTPCRRNRDIVAAGRREPQVRLPKKPAVWSVRPFARGNRPYRAPTHAGKSRNLTMAQFAFVQQLLDLFDKMEFDHDSPCAKKEPGGGNVLLTGRHASMVGAWKSILPSGSCGYLITQALLIPARQCDLITGTGTISRDIFGPNVIES